MRPGGVSSLSWLWLLGGTYPFPPHFTSCRLWKPVCATLRNPGGRDSPLPVPATPFTLMGSLLAASAPLHSLSPPRGHTDIRSHSLKLIRSVRMHWSRCHQGYESDQTLEGCRRGSMDPPDLGTAVIWGVKGEEVEGRGTTPFRGLGSSMTPPTQPV